MTLHGTDRRRRWRPAIFATVVLSAAVSILTNDQTQAAPATQSATIVVERIVHGDLVMAGNSNLVQAGGWTTPARAAVDVDDDHSTICIPRRTRTARPLCADNSSAAHLDLPPAASIITARLYVLTTVADSLRPLRVKIAGPGDRFYTYLGAARPSLPKLHEQVGHDGQPALRSAVWHVTTLVRQHGAGTYTVADIVNERAGPWLPYASWSLIVAYELNTTVDLATLPPDLGARFARRAISWHDQLTAAGDPPFAVNVGGFRVPDDRAVFAKSFHVIAHPGPAGFENLLFNGRPLGNNATPGDPPPPAGITIGTEPDCNQIVDVLNDSICLLGSAVPTKDPGPTQYRSSADGVTPTSGSGVDIDVIRIPNQYLTPRQTTAVLHVQPVDGGVAIPTLLAISIDQPEPQP